MVDCAERGLLRPAMAIIVEDHALTRRFLERTTTPYCTPVACASFEEAVAAIEAIEVRPAAMIVDVHLGSGHHDGFDVVERARARFGAYIPTLVLTGAIDPAITGRANELRTEFLAKPQHAGAIRLFLERARIQAAWALADAIGLHGAIDRFASTHGMTRRQRELIYVMVQAAESGERDTINPNTRKAAIRRILARTGLASFEDLRLAKLLQEL